MLIANIIIKYGHIQRIFDNVDDLDAYIEKLKSDGIQVITHTYLFEA
jgi:hypothetical protein